MKAQLALFVFAVGGLFPLQIAMNARIGAVTGSPLFGVVANFVVGLAALVPLCFALGLRWPTSAVLQGAPAWAWFGGLIGVAAVACSILAGPRLGAAAFFAVYVAGQLCVSMLFDHFGLFGYPVHQFSAGRLAGLALLVSGVVLVMRS